MLDSKIPQFSLKVKKTIRLEDYLKSFILAYIKKSVTAPKLIISIKCFKVKI